MKQDVVETRAAKSVIEKELHNMLMQLHSLQLQIQAQKGIEVDSEAIKKKLVLRQYIALDKSGYQVYIFLISPRKHMLWVLIRSASVRHFLWVPTTYVLVEK